MSVILALAAALVLIALDIVWEKKKSVAMKPVIIKRYLHPGHTWTRLTENGDVLVGVDDFAQSLIGTIDEVKLPRLLRRVKQGGIGWQVWHGHRLVSLVSPVSGWVVQKNEMVLHNPSLVNVSPYGDGWLMRIKPRKLSSQLTNLLSGKAVQQWQEDAKAQLIWLFSGTPALMYQDGGMLLDNLADRCSDDEWKKVAKEFFLVEPNSH